MNIKSQVPNDIGQHNQYIDLLNLKSQEFLDKINSWTEEHKMKINSDKTKAIIFNFTNNYQFEKEMREIERIEEDQMRNIL